MKRAFKYTLLAAAALLGLGGLAVPKIFSGTPPAAAAKNAHEGARPAAAAAAVSVETVKPESLVETIASTGTLRADEGVELQAERRHESSSQQQRQAASR